MVSEKTQFVLDTPGGAVLSFDTVTPADTAVLVLGLVAVVIATWFGRSDKRLWLAPLALLFFVGAVETENYLDRAGRFDRLQVSETGVQLGSSRDSAVARFIPFDQIREVSEARSGRFGQACRVRINLRSGAQIYSVNFYDPHAKPCDQIQQVVARLA